MQTEQAQARIITAIPLSQDWGKLTKYTFDFRRRDGEWQCQSRGYTTAAMAQQSCYTTAVNAA